MKTPRVNINLGNIKKNALQVKTFCDENEIKLTGVVKGVVGDIKIIKTIIDVGITSIGDSRLKNIIKMRKEGINCEIMLLRLPLLSEIETVVEYADISLVSEIDTIKALGATALKKEKNHEIIVMVDVGDLREGVMPDEFLKFFENIINIKGIDILGIGTNLGCYGGILPDYKNTESLVILKNKIKKSYNIDLPLISGGNTATLKLLETNLPKGINNLRVGEAILLGTDVTNQRKIPYLQQNNFTLTAEVIELKEKPSIPKGKMGRDAFGRLPHFINKGIRKRAILAVGRQDVRTEGLSPLSKGMEIIGSSSDHLLVDISECDENFKIGSEISFAVDYGAMLSLMNSDYIYKNYLN